MELVVLGPEDAAEVAGLEVDIFPEDALSATAVCEELSRPWVYARGIRAAGVDDGMCAGGPVLAAYCITRFLGDGEEAELLTIGVRREYRRQKMATQLLDDFFAQAIKRGTKEIFLEVRALNKTAISLYKAYGFSVIDKRKNYYLHPTDDALVMRARPGRTSLLMG